MSRILILTASFGEGHNTASNCLAAALREHPGTEVRIADVYLETVPRFTKVLQAGYSLSINNYPAIWGKIFDFLDKPGLLEATLPMAGGLRDALGRITAEFLPEVIVSTYPLYAYLIRELRNKGHASAKAPLFTVITDSTAINSSWYRAGSDCFVVADGETAEVLRKGGVEESLLKILGFPVAPRLASLSPLDGAASGVKRLLYLPASLAGRAVAVIRELQRLPDVEITVVTGRHEALHEAISHAGVIDGLRTRLVGWTDQIPEMLCSHHLYIGKAGGAIVHEAMAAQCPILVSHVVPGQEEGNIALIERHDIGRLAAGSPEEFAATVRETFAHDAAVWRRWKRHLEILARPSASRDIATLLLETAGKSATSSQVC